MSSEFWKGGETDGAGLPAASLKLEIVGAPYYDDSTSSSNRCIKQCPECGTCYRWETEYTYLVNGSEDDITLTRLSDAEGAEAVQKILASVERYKQQFQDEARMHVESLESMTNQQKALNAAHFFSYNQTIHKEDITFAVPALVHAIVNHAHSSSKCGTGSSLYWVLWDFTRKDEVSKSSLIDLLGQVDANASPPEVQDLLKALCK